jgi:hypothetical protein
MKLLLNIDQIASLKAGKTAPNSTEVFNLTDAHLQALSAETRHWFAEHYDLASGKVSWNAHPNAYTYTRPYYGELQPILLPLTDDKVLQAIQNTMAEAQLRKQEWEKHRDDRRQEILQACRDCLQAGPSTYVQELRYVNQGYQTSRSNSVGYNYLDKYQCPVGTCLQHKMEWPDCRSEWEIHGFVSTEDPSAQAFWQERDRIVEEAKTRYADLWKQDVQTIETLKAELKRLREQWEAKEREAQEETAQAQTRLAAQLEAYVKKIGGVLLERWQAGFSGPEEIKAKLRVEELVQRQLEFTGGEEAWQRAASEEYDGPLNDAQFLQLQTFQNRLPQEAKVTLYRMWNYGIPIEDEVEQILVAEAVWKVGEVAVYADVLLGDYASAAE